MKMAKSFLNAKFKKLSDGVECPIFGLGTYELMEDIATDIVKFSISKPNCVLLIDTAEYYNNEEAVGKGIKESNIPRESIFLVTKLSTTEQGKEGCLKSFHQSLKKLGTKYIDLYLLHAPQGGKVLECYDTMLELKKNGLIRSVGVSNFGVDHLEYIRKSGRELPSVNQIELHPWCLEIKIVDYCKANNIALMAYSPLVKGLKMKDSYVLELSEKYKKTPAQILLRWSIDKNFITIPKSSNTKHLTENIDIFDFSLSLNEIEKLEKEGKKNTLYTAWVGPWVKQHPTINPISDFGPTN